ncbi:TIGR01777 family oxidoreductase [Chengkuizengella sediminis]|uniref:TIGR01777 family oxidoreductase n=1 Tax=Chengkuizengella sediminis TaxID=1885917 RepID=UPI0013896743|nr:TIGR01777 family oxidoreductase [Chengkuizengella sediminis]NDI34105.1 TIGR01777 family protein [Chengkuizengella sediminis]
MSRKIIMPGGSGFLGTSLANYLVKLGYEVVILTRQPSSTKNHIRYVHWDGQTLGDWQKEIEGSYAIINFTGKSVNCIYTKKNKENILSSRINSVKILHESIKNCSNPPEVFIQAASLAIYGDTIDECDENGAHGTGFSVEVCEKWEEVFFEFNHEKTRQLCLRIGFALGKEGGALEPLLKLAKLNLGGTIGTGKQYISWIHIDDLNEMFLHAIDNNQYSGVYNATGPNPVTNKSFMETVRKVLGKGWSPNVPTPIVKFGSFFVMKTAPELALTGRKCVPKRFLNNGFSFKYENLEKALHEIIHE